MALTEQTRLRAIMEHLISGLSNHFSFGKKSDSEIKHFITDITPIINELIPSQKNEEEFLYLIDELRKYILKNHKNAFFPKPYEIEKYCQSYFKKTKYADNWESWELKKGTNIANSGIIYDDELKSQWKDLFPNDMHLALKSFVIPIHNGKRVFGDLQYLRALRHNLKLPFQTTLEIEFTLKQDMVEF